MDKANTLQEVLQHAYHKAERNAEVRWRANVHHLHNHFGIKSYQVIGSNVDLLVAKFRERFPNFLTDVIRKALVGVPGVDNQTRFNAYIAVCMALFNDGTYVPYGGDEINKDKVLVKSRLYPTGRTVDWEPGIIPDGTPELFKQLEFTENTLKLGEFARNELTTGWVRTDRMAKHIEGVYQEGIVAETEHRMYAHLTGYEPVLTPTEKRTEEQRLRAFNADFDGIMPGVDQDIYDIINRKANGTLEKFVGDRLPKDRNGIPADSGFRLVAKLGDDPEPEIRGETTFGLNPKWIDWYCRTNNTAVWKARKAGKEKLRKLQMLVNRYNK